MPVASPLTPKSLLRHRPITSETEEPSVPMWSTGTPRASRPVPLKHETRTCPKSSINPKSSLKKKRSSLNRHHLYSAHQTWHWTVPVGLTMAATVLLALIIQLIGSWGMAIYDDLHYGMPRTTQVDTFVGHEAGVVPSHFIAENLHGRVLIIELPGGDAQHARIFTGPQISGADADHIPVTLTFVDRNKNHHPDMVVQFGSIEIWYGNKQGTFVEQ